MTDDANSYTNAAVHARVTRENVDAILDALEAMAPPARPRLLSSARGLGLNVEYSAALKPISNFVLAPGDWISDADRAKHQKWIDEFFGVRHVVVALDPRAVSWVMYDKPGGGFHVEASIDERRVVRIVL